MQQNSYQAQGGSNYGIYSNSAHQGINNGNHTGTNGPMGTYGSGASYSNSAMNFNRDQTNTNNHYGYGNLSMNNLNNVYHPTSLNRGTMLSSNGTVLNK